MAADQPQMIERPRCRGNGTAPADVQSRARAALESLSGRTDLRPQHVARLALLSSMSCLGWAECGFVLALAGQIAGGKP